MPYSDVRVIAETVGGGFGSKLEAAVEMYAALLAQATGRPVRMVNTREEDLSYRRPRHPMTIHLRSAVAADGTILGARGPRSSWTPAPSAAQPVPGRGGGDAGPGSVSHPAI